MTHIIIQARLSSTRLPGKVLMPFFEGLSILDIQFKTLQECGLPIVLATSTNSADNPLEIWALKNNVDCYRGAENNVLQRFVSCAEFFGIDKLVRVCSDNPFIQSDNFSGLLGELDKGYDYVSLRDFEGTPSIKTHWGLYAEVASVSALKRALSQTTNPFYLEHVTNFIYGHTSEFKVKLIDAPIEVFKRSDLRFTIDTPEDFSNMQHLYKTALNQGSDLKTCDLVNIVAQMPIVSEIMKRGIDLFSK